MKKVLFTLIAIFSLANLFATTTYYSQGSGPINTLTNWNTVRAGGGTSPANFTAGDIFVIQTGNSMTTSAALTISGTGNKLEIESGGILTATNIITVGSFQVDNGGTYNHNAIGSGTNGAANDFPGTTSRVFGASSNVEIQTWGVAAGTSPASFPTIASPGWGNLSINYGTVGGSVQMSGTFTAVQGNLDIKQTGGTTREFRLTSSTNFTLAIGGNLTISGGIFNSSSSGSTHTITVGGNLLVNGGTWSVPGSTSSLTTVNVTGSGTFSSGTISTAATSATWTFGNGLSISGPVFSLGSSSGHTASVTVTGDINISGTGGLSCTSSGNNTVSCTGNFNLGGTGIYQMQNSSSAGKTYVLNIGGNFNMTGGTFTGGSASSAGTVNFTGGVTPVTFIQSAGTVTITKPTAWVVAVGKTVTLNNDLVLSHTTSSVTVNGTLSCATNKVSSTGATLGSFSLASGATLKIGDAAGITAAIATLTGSIQTTTARTFSTGANYEYVGSSANTGTGLPATVNALTINNGGNIALTNTCAVTTALSLQNGKLTLGANNISAATVTNGSSSNYVVTDAAGALKINAVGASNILFPVGPSATGYNPITVNNAGTVDNFSVKVKPTFDNAPFDATIVVNMQWTVSKDGAASGNNVALTPQWNAGDEGASFNRNGSLVLGHYNGAWDEIVAGAVAGTYTTTATATSFSPFGVGNPGGFFNATPANVALSSANPALAAANIGQGLTKQPVYTFSLAVTANAAILNNVNFTAGGTFVGDVSKFQLWYSLTNDLTTASQIGSDLANVGPGAYSFTGLTQGIANGATGYLWITTDVKQAGLSTPGLTVNVAAITTADLGFASASQSGTAFAGADQTIVGATVSFTSSNPAIAAGNIGQGAPKKIIYTFSAAVTNANALLNQLTFTTGGTYAATDVTKFQVWYNTTNTFGTATQLGADITATLGAQGHLLNALNLTIASGATGYFWITTDVDPAATTGNTINVAAITAADIPFVQATVNGTAFAGGDQTIIIPSTTTDDFRSVANGDWASSATWESSLAGSGSWHTSTLAPTNAATSVLIQNGTTVTVSTAVTTSGTTIDNTAALNIVTGGSIAVAANKTLSVDGTINNGSVSTSAITFGSSAVMTVSATGIYNLTGDGGQIPAATWNSASDINVTGIVAAGSITNVANATYGNYTYNCPGQTAGTVVLFSQAGINMGGNFTISNTGTGLAQIISSGGTNLPNVGGDYIQHGGIAMLNPSNTATTVRSMIVIGNFTVDNAVNSPTFRFSNGTATASLVVKGNVSLTNALIENTLTAGNSNFYFAGNNQTFSKTGGSTSVLAGAINFNVISGSTVDLGTGIITGTNFSNSGPYTYTSITGTTANASSIITGVSSTAGLQPGMAISGTGIPANTFITSVGVAAGTSITISRLATASGAVTLTLNSAGASTLKIGDPAGITSSGANGNVQVSGTRSFNGSANYEYKGSVAQVTGNGLPATEQNLTINNAAGVTLTAATTASGILGLTNGVLTTDAVNILTLAPTATYTGGSTSSHVSGPLGMNTSGAATLVFPVGKGGVYHACTVNPTAAGSYSAEYFNSAYSDLTIDGSLQSISNLEYWDIRQLSGTSATISLSLNGTAIPGGTSSNLGAVAHYAAGTWTSVNAGAISPGDATSGTAVSTSMNSFSPFTFGTISAPTPLTLLSFNATLNNGLVKLFWSTANEINVSNYQAERSADGRTFSSIGTVNANNTALNNNYSLNDPTAVNGIVYYRLKMIDRDGQFRYSSIIAFNSKKASVLSVFPNPVKENLFVTHNKAVTGATIQIIAMDGKKISEEKVAKDAVQTNVNTASLTAGIYQLVFINGDELQHIRFVKQ